MATRFLRRPFNALLRTAVESCEVNVDMDIDGCLIAGFALRLAVTCA